MGKTPKDWDIAASALPNQVREVFKKETVIPTGIKHGTVSLILNGKQFEITTYRTDGDYTDGRRPDSVSFTGDLSDDLSRRDFTVNAMAYNDAEGLVDYFGGRTDIENKIIRCVGDPEERFSEDYLRMLRAHRFSCVLGFELETGTLAACKGNIEKIKCISAERIREEFDKIITSDNFSAIRAFLEDFSPVLFPELHALKGVGQNNKYHCFDVYEHTLKVFENVGNTLTMRLAALFHDLGKPVVRSSGARGKSDHFWGHQVVSEILARDILKRLKYSNKIIDTVCKVIGYHDFRPMDDEQYEIRKLINRTDTEITRIVLKFEIADLQGKSDYALETESTGVKRRLALYNAIIKSKDPCKLSDLALNGDEIMRLRPDIKGPRVGETLSFLMDLVLRNPRMNEKERLVRALGKI